jgi:hypothetical protein
LVGGTRRRALARAKPEKIAQGCFFLGAHVALKNAIFHKQVIKFAGKRAFFKSYPNPIDGISRSIDPFPTI